eukprot:CAMPEP_0201577172 /NCGR_PEP_ID=MMETSP0190_2-20130828/23421_1 /ASSEMBLY_ACC=CAM_ASM_000263 /TAXON_ID=37353 /ORGANISM="Rosalina sp." /LENGTH=73 /DNA_ID=CAMNT_0048008911 /DNA_START=446 /DNA_END=667 /DNA_ORIENTATION=-
MTTLLKATGTNPSSIGNANVNGNTVASTHPPNPSYQHPQAMEVCGDDDDEKVNANNASLDLGNGIVLNFPLQK